MAYNVLVVDDSKTMRAIITKTLRMTDLAIGEILEAENGRDAMDKLKAHWIDLVLTDLNMPEMSGIDLVSAMSSDPLLKSIPVIVVSTDGSESRISDLKDKGIREYIHKPFTPEQVSQTMLRVMGGQDAENNRS